MRVDEDYNPNAEMADDKEDLALSARIDLMRPGEVRAPLFRQKSSLSEDDDLQ